MKTEISSIKSKIKKLAQIVNELNKGNDFSITRLTTIKSLSEDLRAVEEFALNFSKRAQEKMENKEDPSHINKNEWKKFKDIVTKAVIQLENYLENRTEEAKSDLREALYEVENLQNDYDKQMWGPVRIIHNSETLIVEYALRCVLSPNESSYWAYLLAREYAERYDSKYGTGLLPQSAPMVEEIADFWCKYYCGHTIKKWISN